MAQPGPKPSHDWESIKASYLASQHSTEVIAKLFGANPKTVAARAHDEGWVAMRKARLAPLTAVVDSQIASLAGQKGTKSTEKLAKCDSQKRLVIPAEERIKDIVPKGDNFRQRVAKQTDRVLDHLESQELATNLQADQFISILEKTEKVGSRARGLDTETQSSRILVNLSVLQLSDVVPEIGVRDIELGQSSPETV